MKFIVSDMSCGHCKATVERAVAEAGGRAEVNLENHEVKIEGLDPDRACEVIRAAGYTPTPT